MKGVKKGPPPRKGACKSRFKETRVKKTMRYESKQYPSSGTGVQKKVKVDSMTPSNKGFAKGQK